MRPTAIIALALAALLTVSLSACGKKEAPPPAAVAPAPVPVPATPAAASVPVAVKLISLGNQINAEKQVALVMSDFSARDIIYAAVETIGSGKASMKAVWTYHKAGKAILVNETRQEIEAAGPATTEFHISKPDGWPRGDYQLEIFLNGASAGMQKFTVK